MFDDSLLSFRQMAWFIWLPIGIYCIAAVFINALPNWSLAVIYGPALTLQSIGFFIMQRKIRQWDKDKGEDERQKA